MMERSPAAMLTRSLLVRKGAAMPTPPAPPPANELADGAREPVPHLVLLGHDVPPPAGRRRFTGGGGGRSRDRRRISLRLDPARHRRLKLAATHLGVSLQDVLIAALDSHIARVAPGLVEGGCTCLAGPARNGEPGS